MPPQSTLSPFAVVQPRTPAYRWLRCGEVKPLGWLREQMQRDLEDGFLGRLDELVPALIKDDDIYGRDRLTRTSRHKDLGTIATDAGLQTQHMWWNSETQSNWWDGLIRTALLLDHTATLPKVRAYVERILATQDADGYLGIYAPDLRYNFAGENGELWAQATLFRGLLAYYEATGEAQVLAAVRAAVQVTMDAWPAGASRPFPDRDSVCGDAHGLAITDVLERLGEVTGDREYGRYAAWLYEAYSASGVSENDAQYGHLIDPAYRFRGHGVHTYEHLRSLLAALYATGNPALEAALSGYLAKLDRCLAPSGGPIGDEFIGARDADASATGYETCSIHELLDSYTHLLQKIGDAHWGDAAEWLLFNAGQGARHPDGRGITYLRTDNSTSLTGPLHPGDPPTDNGPQTRYKVSPAHQDVAVCCAPNAGRMHPYYARSMWLRSADGLAATLYGPCEMQTQVQGVDVRIREATDYPFGLAITFAVEVGQPVEFTLSLRRPAWATTYSLTGAEVGREDGGWIHVRRHWAGQHELTVEWEAKVELPPWGEERCVSHGPLLFALPLAGVERRGREYAPGFCDTYVDPAENAAARPVLPPEPAFTVIRKPVDPALPWDSVALAGELLDADGNQVRVRLVPMGGTVLRQVTFAGKK